MERPYLAACLYSVLMLSLVVNLVQIALRPLDWIGLKGPRQSITGFYFRGLVVCAVFWLECVCGTKIIVTGDELPRNERVLLLCNHVNVEFLHILCLAQRIATADAPKGILKESLKWVPIVWVGVLEGMILVKRAEGKVRRDRTLEQMRAQVADLCADRAPLWLFMFPEGTWLSSCEESKLIKERANAFAKKAGFEELHHVLFPHTAGFTAVLEGVRQQPHCLDAVYDVTVAYSKPCHPVKIGTAAPPSLVGLCSGPNSKAPKEVHFNVRRHPLPDGVPKEKAEAANWLRQKFAVEKEELLGEFGKAQRFPGPERSTPRNLPELLAFPLFMASNLLVLLGGVLAHFGVAALVVFLAIGAAAAAVAATADTNPALSQTKHLGEKTD